MPNIKIFVSNRIDLDAEKIDNQLFIPVRCGAVFDEKASDIIGDNTGDNISDKRMSFNELTVLYWAWKNQSADWYGLCHYRRFLCLKNIPFEKAEDEHANGCIRIDYLNKKALETFGLTESFMRSEIEKYDAVFAEPIDLAKMGIKNNYEAMKCSPDYHFIKDIDTALDIIKEKYPEFYPVATEYMFKYDKSRLYNCFIMKKDVFDLFCNWLFGILFELEKRIDMSLYSMQQYRTPGTIAERLTGIFALWLERQCKYKIKNAPVLFIEHPEKISDNAPAFKQKNIAVASNFNNAYVPIFSVFLKSCLQHIDKNNNYDFNIIGSDFTNDSKSGLLEIIKEYPNVSLRFINPEWSLAGVKTEIFHNVYSKDLYYRVVIPYLMRQYDKILVVDADMVCRQDIADLFDEDVSNYLAAGVKDTVLMGYLNGMDPHKLSYCKNYMKMNNPYSYINTGVLLFNAKKYRDVYSLEFLRDFIFRQMGKVEIYEQDMLNMLLDGHLKFLDAKWNIYTQSNDFVKNCLRAAPFEAVQQLKAAKVSGTGIIHYAAHPKPWWDAKVDEAELFWKYARRSPFYENILQILMQKTGSVAGIPTDYYHHIRMLIVLNQHHFLKWKARFYHLCKAISFGKRKADFKRKYKAISKALRLAKEFKKWGGKIY